MDKIIIFGTTNHSHMIRRIIEKEKAAEVVAYTINKKFMSKDGFFEYEGYPVIPFEEVERYFEPSKYKILNTIGYTKMNEIRREKNEECLRKGYDLFTFVSKDAIVFSEITGFGNIVMPGAYIGTNVTLGVGNIIYSGCTLTHDIQIGNYSFLAAGCTIGGNVNIGNNCFLGLNSTIKNSVNIADFSLIGAATYISKDTQKYGIYVPERSKKLEKSSLEIW